MFTLDELLKATRGKLTGLHRVGVLKGISIDSRTLRRKDAFLAIKGNNLDGHDFIDAAIKRGAQAVICQGPSRKAGRNKKVPFIRVSDTTKALGAIAAFQRKKFDIPLIALTGSNGKTTTKDMVFTALSDSFRVLKNSGTQNNHIGLPLTLTKLESGHDIAVVELGTNHPGEIAYLAKICSPDVAIFTNIGPAHLEHFKDTRGVLKEKSLLLKYMTYPGIVIFNADDPLLRKRMAKNDKKIKSLGFGIENRCDFRAGNIKITRAQTSFTVNEKYRFTLPILGYYNIYNALAAITVARIFGVGYRSLAARLSGFNLPENRLNLIEVGGIKFINDAYNSNPVSLRQALDVLANLRVRGRKIFVMGDMLELGEGSVSFHRQAGRKASGVCDLFIAVGGLSRYAAEEARNSGLSFKNIFICNSNMEARRILFEGLVLSPDDIVLLKGSRGMKLEEIIK